MLASAARVLTQCVCVDHRLITVSLRETAINFICNLLYIYCLPQLATRHRPAAFLFFRHLLTVASQTNVIHFPELKTEGSSYQLSDLSLTAASLYRLQFEMDFA